MYVECSMHMVWYTKLNAILFGVLFNLCHFLSFILTVQCRCAHLFIEYFFSLSIFVAGAHFKASADVIAVKRYSNNKIAHIIYKLRCFFSSFNFMGISMKWVEIKIHWQAKSKTKKKNIQRYHVITLSQCDFWMNRMIVNMIGLS